MTKKKRDKAISEKETVKLPNGDIVTRQSIKDGLVAGATKAFRGARKKYSSSEDWIKMGAKSVIDNLMDADEFFDKMLEMQKVIKEGVEKGLKKRLFGKKKK